MKSLFFSCLFSSVLATVFVGSAHAQIESQTPRPELPDNLETLVETVQPPQARIGQSGRTVQVPRSGALLFASFDMNGNYIIDRNEIDAGIARAFKAADKDGSGVLSLVELEGWRVAALGSEHASPTNFTFAPNFARTVSEQKFTQVLSALAQRLDADDQGAQDGFIAMADLLRPFSPPRAKGSGDNCASRIRDERRRVEQQCRVSRTGRGY